MVRYPTNCLIAHFIFRTALGDPESDTQTPQSAKSDLTDVYVLGFQELDLSAEALIYSTNNFREEAYTKAILAALGEKAVLYEKVRVHILYTYTLPH